MISYDYQLILNIIGYPYYFPQYEEDQRNRLYSFMRATDYASNLSRGLKGMVNLFGVVINIVHLRVLTRKEMRDSSVNVVLAFMALSDLITMTSGAIDELRPTQTVLDGPSAVKYCVSSNTLSFSIMTFFLELFRRCFQRYSSWLSILMATIRAIVIKYATESKFTGLTTPKFGVIISLVQFLICFSFSMPLILSLSIVRDPDWVPPAYCNQFPKNYSEPQYRAKFAKLNSERLSFIDGLTTSFIPCISYPILTAILAFELRKARKKNISRGRDESKNERATKLIIFMTVSFMIAEIPQGIVNFLQPFYTKCWGFIFIFANLQDGLIILSHVNACSHLFLCLAMSSKYRDTFYETFGLKAEQEGPNVIIQSDQNEASHSPSGSNNPVESTSEQMNISTNQ